MKQLTFKRQIFGGVILVLIGNVLAFIFHQGIFVNIAWILYGLLFILHPVYPAHFINTSREKTAAGAARFAGVVCIIIGLAVWFYP